MLKQASRAMMKVALSTVVLASAGVFVGSGEVWAAPSQGASRGTVGTAVMPASAPPVVATLPAAAVAVVPGVLTFQAWKSLRVEEARLVLERMMMETQMQQMQQAQNAAERLPGERQAVVKQIAPPVTNTANVRQVTRGLRSGRVDQRAEAKAEARADGKVEQARINLEIAQELAITDYLQIYLSQFRSSDALRDVARRMNPEEVAELLLAYQQQKIAGQGAVADTSLAASRLCSGAALASPIASPASR